MWGWGGVGIDQMNSNEQSGAKDRAGPQGLSGGFGGSALG